MLMGILTYPRGFLIFSEFERCLHCLKFEIYCSFRAKMGGDADHVEADEGSAAPSKVIAADRGDRVVPWERLDLAQVHDSMGQAANVLTVVIMAN